MTILKTEELVELIAEGFTTEDNKVSKTEAKRILNDFVSVIEDVVFEQQKGIRLGGIGTFKVDVLPEREFGIRNSTEKVTKPERYGLKFVVNKGFKRDLEEVPVD